MSFKKPSLLYEYDALEPYIDSETMTLHHQKHHTAYVNGLCSLSLNSATNSTLHDLLGGLYSNEELSESDKIILTKFGGGHYNHSLFWEYMHPESSEKSISPMLMDRIAVDFGDIQSFKKQFADASAKVFGSGWCWWVYNPKIQKSEIITTKDQGNPIMEDSSLVCLLGLDVWEHAYYLKFRNERVRYIDTWWNVVNWEMVSRIHDELALNGRPIVLSNDGYIDLKPNIE